MSGFPYKSSLPLKCERALPSVGPWDVKEVSVQETLMRLGRLVSVLPARLTETTAEARKLDPRKTI